MRSQINKANTLYNWNGQQIFSNLMRKCWIHYRDRTKRWKTCMRLCAFLTLTWNEEHKTSQQLQSEEKTHLGQPANFPMLQSLRSHPPRWWLGKKRASNLPDLQPSGHRCVSDFPSASTLDMKFRRPSVWRRRETVVKGCGHFSRSCLWFLSSVLKWMML